MYICVPSVQLYIYTGDLGNQFYCNATKQTKTPRNYVSQMYTRTHINILGCQSALLSVYLCVYVCECMLHVFFAAIALVSSAPLNSNNNLSSLFLLVCECVCGHL